MNMGTSDIMSTNSEYKNKKSAIESQIAAARQRNATLEEDLKSMREVVSNTEITLELTRANICIMQGRYDREVALMKSLEEELRTSAAMLEDAEATREEAESLGAPQNKGRFKPFKSARKSFGTKSPKKE
jgi:chromosome segregation ATPase